MYDESMPAADASVDSACGTCRSVKPTTAGSATVSTPSMITFCSSIASVAALTVAAAYSAGVGIGPLYPTLLAATMLPMRAFASIRARKRLVARLVLGTSYIGPSLKTPYALRIGDLTRLLLGGNDRKRLALLRLYARGHLLVED